MCRMNKQQYMYELEFGNDRLQLLAVVQQSVSMIRRREWPDSARRSALCKYPMGKIHHVA
jgi:hypothetical protein